eukprot:s4331_g5.t1
MRTGHHWVILRHSEASDLDWVRDNIVILGTVKTALNVADLNTKKLTYAWRAFLLYHLSQVEYSEGEEIVRTGEDEYERHEQEKKLKEYVGNNQVKNLIRLIQVFSVIRPSTAVWIKASAEAVEAVEASVDNGIMEGMDAGRKFTMFEVAMLIAVILLIAPHVLEAVKKLGKIYARMSAIDDFTIAANKLYDNVLYPIENLLTDEMDHNVACTIKDFVVGTVNQCVTYQINDLIMNSMNCYVTYQINDFMMDTVSHNVMYAISDFLMDKVNHYVTT